MGWIQWLVYILSLFIPPFGFITFWVLGWNKDGELSRVGQWSLVASFIGVFLWAVLGAAGAAIGWLTGLFG
jgi:uncharacterized membrane protein